MAFYIFESDGNGNWGSTETLKLEASDGESNDHFGWSVSLSNNRLLVGAETDDDVGDIAGSAYLFDSNGATWTQITKLLALDGSRADLFGRSVSLSFEIAVVGAPAEDEGCGGGLTCDAGAAYLFHLASTVSPYCFGSSCPCGNDDSVRGCANSTGRGAQFRACGNTSATTDDLVLTAMSLPTNQPGLVYMGGGAIVVPFGDGLRCVGAGGVGIFRYAPPLSSGSTGTITLGPGIVARSQSFSPGGEIDPGETWHFQAWYRDPMGSPCGAFFDLSNALAVTFTP